MADDSSLRVLVVATGWCWREAVLRVLEQRGLAPEPVAADSAVRRAAAAPFDVALVDLDEGDEALGILTGLHELGLSCIAVSDGRGRSAVAAALNASASYAVKSELDPDRLSQLVRLAASGDALFVQAGRRALESLVDDGDGGAGKYDLTPRESDVLRGIAGGLTNAEIAQSLHLAPSSVKKLVSRCLTRLGARNRVEAALLARREGLVDADEPIRACA